MEIVFARFIAMNSRRDGSSSGLSPNDPPRKLPFPPHIFFFLSYNFIYFTPLFLVFLWGYGSDAASQMAAFSKTTMFEIFIIYVAGIFSFIGGTQCTKFLRYIFGKKYISRWQPIWFQISLVERSFIGWLIPVFILSKIALIPLGVYHQYAFDTGSMTGFFWGFSAFCSETLILAQVLVLFSKTKHNVRFFLLLAAINGINLMHGTRIFFIITMMMSVFYLYVRGYLTVRRILLVCPALFLCTLLFTYLIYLSRTGGGNAPLSLLSFFSPIVYESVFSQLSLISVVSKPTIWNATGNSIHFINDVLIQSIPTLIFPNKSHFEYFSKFTYLSPIGAFNGYANGLIYFGFLFPIFYFFLGAVADWLYRKAQRSTWWFIFYVSFTVEFLFHIMRDGYLIPVKIFINTAQWIASFLVIRSFFAISRSNHLRRANRLVTYNHIDNQ